jgi:hypothetical protein
MLCRLVFVEDSSQDDPKRTFHALKQNVTQQQQRRGNRGADLVLCCGVRSSAIQVVACLSFLYLRLSALVSFAA